MAGTVIEDERLQYHPIFEDELMVVAPAAPIYTDWQQKPVGIAQLLEAPFVTREEGSGTWTEIESYLKQQGYDSGALRIVARMDNPDAIVKSVEQGLGITVLSSLAASEYLRKGDVLVFALDGKSVRRKIYLVRDKLEKLPPEAEAFANFAVRLGK